MKTCTKCQTTVKLESFPPNAKCRDGRSSWCRSCHRAASRGWREATGYNARHAARRRGSLANQRAGRVPQSDADRAYLSAVAADPCAYCGADASELDHIVPGVDDVENFAASCRSCNARKQDISLLGFLLRRSLLRDGYDEMRSAWLHAGRLRHAA